MPVQANHGARERLRIAGVPVGQLITDLQPELHAVDARALREGSIIVVVATDAPLPPHQFERGARRAGLGLARTGSISATTSGDIFLAFSTSAIGDGDHGVRTARLLDKTAITPVFAATVQATEEAIVNALVAAETLSGVHGNRVHALPHDRLRQMLRDHNALR